MEHGVADAQLDVRVLQLRGETLKSLVEVTWKPRRASRSRLVAVALASSQRQREGKRDSETEREIVRQRDSAVFLSKTHHLVSSVHHPRLISTVEPTCSFFLGRSPTC